MILILRLIHIVFGAYWMGAIVALAIFVEPSVRAAGPAGGAFMAQLQKRKFSVWAMISAAITIVSGILLFGIDSQWFKSGWTSSRMAIALQTGALLAIIAAAIGSAMARPAAERLATVMPRLAQAAPGPERDKLAAESQKLLARLSLAGRAAAALVTITVALMAVARYL